MHLMSIAIAIIINYLNITLYIVKINSYLFVNFIDSLINNAHKRIINVIKYGRKQNLKF